jgi:transcriptional regulator with XRE-family HTH domain
MKGITQQQMADVIPTDVSNYSRKESGAVSITQTEWNKLAKFLEVPVEEIYEEDEPRLLLKILFLMTVQVQMLVIVVFQPIIWKYHK